MNKKAFRVFINSFAVSLLAIWGMNELLLVKSGNLENDFEIPEKNIVLFLQNDAYEAVSLSSAPIEQFSLPLIKRSEISNIDPSIFIWDEEKESMQNAESYSANNSLDIPLEKSAQLPAKNIIKIQPSDVEKTQKNESVTTSAVEEETGSKFDLAMTYAETPIIPLSSPDIKGETASVAQELSFIPIETGLPSLKENGIEVVNSAPESQIAMLPNTISVDTLSVKNIDASSDEAERDWVEMASLESENDNPWVVAKGMKYPKNSKVTEEVFFDSMNESEIQAALAPKALEQDGKEVKVAEIVKNILIPIPDHIMSKKDLTPQLVSAKKTATSNDDTVLEQGTTETDAKNGGIFKSIASMFSGSDSKTGGDDESGADNSGNNNGGVLSSIFGGGKTGNKQASGAKILPAEMKLSFQPGRAEISGQTLKWIEAFAATALEDSSVFLEIRIDRTSSFELQQKRLSLLHNILTNKGVGYHQINTVFTSREPNSFIIRTLRLNDNNSNNMPRANNRQALPYQAW